MKIEKGKTQKPPKHVPPPERAGSAAVRPAPVEAEKRVELEQALMEEVAGTHASPARLKKIVERVLGGGDDSEVQALVQKLVKAARAETAPGY